jgi:EAL domain-containing protein (putative c-di-GMP-specific phosphodiesterase class I)
MALDRLDMEGSLRKAIENGELVVYYQPKVCLKTGNIVGAEALVRWLHPRMGQVSPGEFIPLAEETGLIIPLGDLVLNTVCQQIRHWHESGLQVPLLSINISARQFRQENLVETICRRLAQANIEGSAIELELTESMVMQDADGAIGTLRELKQLGVALALDDFGTGYSSLAYLKRFPIDTLKIDRSFIRDITTDRDDAAIASAVVAMAHSLKLKVVAEGVETREQLALLQQDGCDELQGYLFSHPVPADAFAQQLLDGKTLPLDALPTATA